MKIETIYGFATNPTTNQEQLEEWISSQDEGLLLLTVSNPNIKTRTIDKLLSYDMSTELIIMLIKTQGRNLTESQLTAVLQKLNKFFYNNGIHDTTTIISKLVADIASLPNLTETHLIFLTNDLEDDSQTQEIIASRENLPLSVINLLRAPNKPSPIIIHLINGPSAIPDDILIRLASNADEGIREAVANRTDLPFSVIQTLLNQSNVTSHTKIALATQPNLSNELVAQFSNDPIQEVRAAIARRSDTSDSLISKLAYDPSPIVREEVARNPRTNQEILNNFLADTNRYVRQSALENFNTK